MSRAWRALAAAKGGTRTCRRTREAALPAGARVNVGHGMDNELQEMAGLEQNFSQKGEPHRAEEAGRRKEGAQPVLIVQAGRGLHLRRAYMPLRENGSRKENETIGTTIWPKCNEDWQNELTSNRMQYLQW